MSETPTIRAFLALEIQPAIRQQLGRELATLRRSLPDARWVREQGLHLTLKFLGEAERSRLDELVAELAPVVAGCPVVEVQLGGAGFFPSPARPRVAWVGGLAAGAAELAEAADVAAGDHGFERERRRWSLHLTVARLPRPWTPAAVAALVEWGEELRLPSFTAAEVVLFQSSLLPSGAVYTPLARMPCSHASGSSGGETGPGGGGRE